jgi:NAD(P)-dependent dehydrogenase (short-subunit alcohol dehydrogenase family)
MKSIKNKVAIVTGAGSGIGKATALLLSSEGAKVVISDINENHGNSVAELIMKNGGDAIFIKADTSIPEDNKNLVDKTVKRYGTLDIAVNNAGIGGQLASIADYPVEGWQKVIATNLSGVFYGMHYQIPAMLKNGGSIINVASILGMVGTKFAPAYVAAKHGVVGLTKTAALEFASNNIRINSIGPGYIKTPMVTAALDETALKGVAALHPIGRLGEPEEVAELILWLASPSASFVTGSYYAVDGGYLAQ